MKTVGTLYRPVSPSDPKGANKTGIYKARVRINVAAEKKDLEYEQTRQYRYIKREIFWSGKMIGKGDVESGRLADKEGERGWSLRITNAVHL